MNITNELVNIRHSTLALDSKLASYLGILKTTSPSSIDRLSVSEEIDRCRLKMAQIELVNQWGPYEHYITVSGHRGVMFADFQNSLRELLKRANCRLFGHASTPRPASNVEPAHLVGYVSIENLSKAGNRCQLHAHITCKASDRSKVVTTHEVQDAFEKAASKLIVASTLKPFFSPNIHSASIEANDGGEALTKYNLKQLDYGGSFELDYGPGIYMMLGSQLGRVL